MSSLEHILGNIKSSTIAGAVTQYIVELRDMLETQTRLADSHTFEAYSRVEEILSDENVPVGLALRLAKARAPLAEYLAQRWEAAREALFGRANDLSQFKELAEVEGAGSPDAYVKQAVMLRHASLFPMFVLSWYRDLKVESFDDLAVLTGQIEEHGMDFMDEVPEKYGDGAVNSLIESYIDWAVKEYNRQLAEFKSISSRYPYPAHPDADKELKALYSSFFASGEFGRV